MQRCRTLETMQRGRIHSQDGVVLTLQIQPSPLAPRRERRFSLPRNVPSGESSLYWKARQSRLFKHWRDIRTFPVCTNCTQLSDKDKFAHRCHFRCRAFKQASRNFVRHTSFVGVEALEGVESQQVSITVQRLGTTSRWWSSQLG